MSANKGATRSGAGRAGHAVPSLLSVSGLAALNRRSGPGFFAARCLVAEELRATLAGPGAAACEKRGPTDLALDDAEARDKAEGVASHVG